MGPGEREKFILTGPFRKCFLQVRSKTNVGNLAGNRLAEGGVLSAKGYGEPECTVFSITERPFQLPAASKAQAGWVLLSQKECLPQQPLWLSDCLLANGLKVE